MRLNHLTLQGYKSFATKTEFLFPTGITAIVGPNGSGKSNVADAIRWVLGEQRMRAMRGKSTADMIFAGGRRRARAGMAEVSLTFDNADGWLPIEFSEVTITRRAYRSGENEYLLNGSRVRLRDITALLAESGLSQRTYTVIGQGLVDAALSLRAQERRTLFEDAAGISLYRSQRRDAVRRLDETQRNLERVYDIVSEVTPRLRRLARDAERVEDHRRLSAHLQRLQRTWYGHHWGQQQSALERALEVAQVLEANLEARQIEESELGQRLAQLRQQEGDLRARLGGWHRENASFHDEFNEVQRELAVAEERARLLNIRREELLAELGPLNDQREAQVEKVAQARTQIERLELDLAERKERLTVLEREWTVVEAQAQEPVKQRVQAEQELRVHRGQLEQLNQTLMETREKVSRLESEQAVAEERARQLQARREEILAELGPLDNQKKVQDERVSQAHGEVEELERGLTAHKQRLVALEHKWEAARQQAQKPDPQRIQVEQELQAHRARLKQFDRELVQARAEAARLTGEQEALNRLQAAGSAYDAGVRTLLQANLDGVLGPLATLMQVLPKWDVAIEAGLGADLQAVVVERATVVENVRQILESAGGRLTVLPLDDLRPVPPLPDGALSGAEVVVCDAHVRPAVEAMLGSVALCDDVQAARTLLPNMPHGGRCVTAAGMVLRADGALSVGRGGGDKVGLLADERARRELPVQIDQIQNRCREIEQQQRVENERIAALETQLAGLDQQAAAAKEEAVRAERKTVGQVSTEVAVAKETLRNQRTVLHREKSLLGQLVAQMKALRHQADELESEHSATVTRIQELSVDWNDPDNSSQLSVQLVGLGAETGQGFRAQLENARQRCRQIEEQQQAKAKQITALEAKLQELTQQIAVAGEEAARIERETVGQARIEVAVVEESLRSQQATLQRETTLSERLGAQMTARHQRAEELEGEQSELVARTQELRVETSKLEAQQRQVRARVQPAEDELVSVREEQVALEQQERRARDRVRETEARQNRAELDVARCRDEIKLLARHIEEDLGLVELELSDSVTVQSPLPLRPLVSQLPVVEELPPGLEEEIQRLKAQLRRLGSINPNALDDYAEVEERHRFLTEQSADLEMASGQLRQVVGELDELMAAAFRETFDAVAERFAETFPVLFDGGSARLELTEPDDLLNSGVDIVARPPGKRAQRLALLSGGERALTAAALIFAILRVSPAPFCVLDEVDAMLDEANVARFRTLLQELAKQTQFIIITHTRGTVEAADTIYGISMGADAVSQMVSLELE
ncbi:MAG: AAA family ATPase [Chloroflexi bacterium]|nr:AAA family ATPase [Chloroflexota bacterium]